MSFHRVVLLVACAVSAVSVPGVHSAERDVYESQIAPLLAKHCLRCHGADAQEGKLRLDRLDRDFIKGGDAEHWHEALNRLNVGEMPPQDEPQPTPAEREVLTDWLTRNLKQAAATRRANGGQVVLRRLNRREYGNTLRDLFGVPLNFEKVLPPDGLSAEGFQNNGQTLAMSPLHFDYYLKTARLALDKAVPTGPRPPRVAYRFDITGIEPEDNKKAPSIVLDASFLESHDGETSGKPPVGASLGRISRGSQRRAVASDQGIILSPGLRARGTGIPGRQTANPAVIFRFREFPTEGTVSIRVTAAAVEPDAVVKPQVRVFIGTLLDDGTEFAFLEPGKLVTHSTDQPGVYEFRGRLEDLPLPFRKRDAVNRGDLNVMMVGVINSVDAEVDNKRTPQLLVSRVDFEAPVFESWPTPACKEVFFTGSPEPHEEDAFARRILERFMTRAYRRPAETAEVDRVFRVWKLIREYSRPKVEKKQPEPEPEPIEPGINVDYFEPNPRNVAIETLARLKPATSGVVPEIRMDVPQLRRRDAFALRFSGTLNIPHDGKYSFWLTSDDGSRMYLDGRLVIDNDGLHGNVEKQTQLQLDAGPHGLVVTYFDNGGGDGLKFEWQGQGVPRGPVAPRYLTVGGSLPVGRPSPASFEDTIRQVLPAVLTSPGFLYLAQPDAESKLLTDFELASRLSYLFWSTMPDDELIALAGERRLKTPDVLRMQVRRMLKDNRSREFVRNFTDQWLDLDAVQRVAVSKTRFQDFFDETRLAMQEETRSFFAEVLHNDLSALNFIDSDFTMLNDHLAEHYRIAGVSGPTFQRVTLKPEDHRGGLLTHGSVLTGGSDGTDSHPIRRGVWLLKKLLDDPPPDPPPNVPNLNQEDPQLSGLPLKKQLEVHRDNPACANCHRKIDPWGVAFENYSAVGRWRGPNGDKPAEKGIDASSTLPDGTEFAGLDELKAYVLSERQDDLARSLTKNLTAYALGRSLDFTDTDLITNLSDGFQKNGFRIRWLIEEIVVSDAFRTR